MLHFISNSIQCDMMLTGEGEEIAKYEYIWCLGFEFVWADNVCNMHILII